MTDYIVPMILFLSMAMALGKKENAYDHMLHGAAAVSYTHLRAHET